MEFTVTSSIDYEVIFFIPEAHQLSLGMTSDPNGINLNRFTEYSACEAWGLSLMAMGHLTAFHIEKRYYHIPQTGKGGIL